MLRRILSVVVLLACGAPASAHPVPFSYFDLRVRPERVEATLVAHAVDVAHELGVAPERLLADGGLAALGARALALPAERVVTTIGGRVVTIAWARVEALPARDAVRFTGLAAGVDTRGPLTITARLFPYDPNHQTFVNVYAGGRLVSQAIVAAAHPTTTLAPAVPEGARAVLGRFVPLGVWHIAIGPDHILFLVGLLLLGGTTGRIVRIVTAFTIGHSITLSLAVVGILSPPARVIEPAIALSIVYVGLDNLIAARDGRDVRAIVAATFGLVHGFGFASVLREIGLAPGDIGWSLFSFNAGVEIGQLVIVAAIATTLGLVRRRSHVLAERLVHAGSIVVAAAGAYWFVQRVFFSGGA